MAYPNRRISLVQPKAALADSRSKSPLMPEQTGLCRFTNHHKEGHGNSRKMQHHTGTSTHQPSEACDALPAYSYAGMVTSEVSSTPTMRHHLHLGDVSVGYSDNQIMDLVVYHPISRPWQELGRSESGSAMNAVAGSPLERWERESIRDQAWNGVAGIYGGPDADRSNTGLLHEWRGQI